MVKPLLTLMRWRCGSQPACMPKKAAHISWAHMLRVAKTGMNALYILAK